MTKGIRFGPVTFMAAIIFIAMAYPAFAQLITFTPDTPANADDVNDNFQYLETGKVNRNGDTISGNGGASAGLLSIENTSTNDYSSAVKGEITNSSPGLYSAGVRGINNGTGGSGIGVYGSQNGSGWGVYGITPDGIGVYGVTTTGSAIKGVSSGTGNAGTFSGKVSITGSTGALESVLNVTNGSTSINAYAVKGEITSTSPGISSTGVRGINNGTGSNGVGVSGYHTGNGSGVVGVSSGGYGVAAQSVSGHGLYALSGTGDAGYFAGDVTITGALSKGSGTFVQPHAKDASKEIRYAFFEGPEHAVFLRGSARLRDGKAVVELPGHFRVVAAAQGIQVNVTPYSADTRGLAVVERSPERIVVRELAGGRGDFEFGYFITAIRAGFRDFQPVAENTHFKPEKKETAQEFEQRFARDDLTSKALRGMLIANGLMDKDGKLDASKLKELGWSVAEKSSRPFQAQLARMGTGKKQR